jgi:hypothetical protein
MPTELHDPYSVPSWLSSFFRHQWDTFAEFASSYPEHPDVPRYLPFREPAVQYGEARDRGRRERMATIWRQTKPFLETEGVRHRAVIRATLEHVADLLFAAR